MTEITTDGMAVFEDAMLKIEAILQKMLEMFSGTNIAFAQVGELARDQ